VEDTGLLDGERRMTGDEYRIKVSVRNNLILNAIEDFGYTKISKFCEEHGLNTVSVRLLIQFRKRPIEPDGEFCTVAKDLMEVLGAAPTDLWTAEQLELCLTKNFSEKAIGQRALDKLLGMDNGELIAIAPDEEFSKRESKVVLIKALETLTPREQYVLVARFGLGCEEQTLEEISEDIDVTRERVRQIEAKALRKLRKPYHSNKLQEVFYDRR
jgi:RNA polymerase sigma factor (sigma-70 family)